MKNVVAVIRPSKFFATKNLLAERGFMSMSTYNVLGHGRKRMGFSPAIGMRIMRMKALPFMLKNGLKYSCAMKIKTV